MTINTFARARSHCRMGLTKSVRATPVVSNRSPRSTMMHLGPRCFHHDSDRVQRRYFTPRYRVMDILNRKPSWINRPRSHEDKTAIKRAMAHAMSEHSSGPKYANADNVQSWSDDISGLRPGRNIEDAERDAIDHLFRSRGRASHEHDLWMSPLRNIQNHLASHHKPKDVSPHDVIAATANTRDADIATAPGTSPASKRPLQTASCRNSTSEKDSKSVAGHDRGLSYTPKYEDLDRVGPQTVVGSRAAQTEYSRSVTGYGPVVWNEPDGLASRTAEEASKDYHDLGDYQPFTWNEPDGLPRKTDEELTKNYSDLDKYKPVSWNEPHGLQPKTPEELSKNYGDLSEYGAVRWNEPDGLPPQTPEELSKQYDDLEKYDAVRWNEPDGLPDPTPEEASKVYDDLDKYKPVEWNEPNGLRSPTPEELSKAYEDLDTYADPFTAPDETIKAHAASQSDDTVKAKALSRKVEVDSVLPKYDDLHKYGPVHWNEPDGLREPTLEEKSKKYEDLHLYGAVHWNEPDGLPKPTPEELSKAYDDLPAYEANMNSESEVIPNRVHPEEASKMYSDLSKYDMFENDGPSTARVHPEQVSKAYEDLDLYRAEKIDSPETQYHIHPEDASKAYQDLGAYQPMYYDEPTGRPATHRNPASDESGSADPQTDKSAGQAVPYPKPSMYDIAEPSRDNETTLTADAIRARVGRDSSAESRQRQLDKDMSRHESAWDTLSAEAHKAVKIAKQINTSKLTGSDSRNFPGELSTAGSSSLLSEQRQSGGNGTIAAFDSECKDDVELSSMDESFPPPESRRGPALNPAASLNGQSGFTSAVDDLYSTIPQGLQTSYLEECAETPREPSLVSHYKPVDPAEPSPAVANREGTYKVLAYDRTTQSVSVAEMTSGVLDSQDPISPSEVMLKLSNPARFLPHFGPLHSEGYEVVSGSGDVLIFRKMRPGSPDSASGQAPHGTVNPIDLMGKPVMGNFASPTGFVNYESLADNDAMKPEPPFRSNIDVRKEEPVFSGSKEQQKHNGSKKKSIGKRIAVGGAWTIGIAYAVGVMAEFFSTGGLDGLGPKGL